MTEKSSRTAQRSLYLDAAKGIAIILVVIGHEIQFGCGTDILAFRLIYSFHMPLFMLISGMVFSVKFHDFPSYSLNIPREITKSVRGLLVPFISWTLVNAVIFHRGSMPEYLCAVIKSPDGSLWFLPVLLLCRVFFVIVHSLCVKLFGNLSALVLAVMTAVIFAALKIFPSSSFMGYGLFAAHFPYFALGVFLYQFRERLSGLLSSIPAIAAMIVMFAVIAPCWYLDSPNPFVISHGELLFRVIKRISPVPGIFLMMSLTKLIMRVNFKPLINALAFTGKLTLGIYAYHLYFLEMFPPVIVSLSAGIILTVITEKIPALRSLLLGK